MASNFSNLATTNFSLYTIPLCWMTCLAPRMYSMRAYKSATTKEIDTRQPRTFAPTISNDQSLDSKTRGRLMRAEAAMANGFENLALFASAVVAGNAAGLSAELLNGISGAYVLSRVLYNVIYIGNETKAMAMARGGVYMGGLALCFTLFIRAGNKMMRVSQA